MVVEDLNISPSCELLRLTILVFRSSSFSLAPSNATTLYLREVTGAATADGDGSASDSHLSAVGEVLALCVGPATTLFVPLLSTSGSSMDAKCVGVGVGDDDDVFTLIPLHVSIEGEEGVVVVVVVISVASPERFLNGEPRASSTASSNAVRFCGEVVRG